MSTTHDTSNSTGSQSPEVVNASTFFIAASLVPIIGICIALTLSCINRHIKHLSRHRAQPKYKLTAAQVRPITAEQMRQLETIHQQNPPHPQPHPHPQPQPAALVVNITDPTAVDESDGGGGTDIAPLDSPNVRVLPVAYPADNEYNDGAVEIRPDNREEKIDGDSERDVPLRQQDAFDSLRTRVSSPSRRPTLPTPQSFDISTPVPVRRYADVAKSNVDGSDSDEWSDDFEDAAVLV
jgi:hypothetical protein